MLFTHDGFAAYQSEMAWSFFVFLEHPTISVFPFSYLMADAPGAFVSYPQLAFQFFKGYAVVGRRHEVYRVEP